MTHRTKCHKLDVDLLDVVERNWTPRTAEYIQRLANEDAANERDTDQRRGGEEHPEPDRPGSDGGIVANNETDERRGRSAAGDGEAAPNAEDVDGGSAVTDADLARTSMTLKDDDGKTLVGRKVEKVAVNLRLDKPLVEIVDTQCRQMGMKKTDWIRMALWQFAQHNNVATKAAQRIEGEPT